MKKQYVMYVAVGILATVFNGCSLFKLQFDVKGFHDIMGCYEKEKKELLICFGFTDSYLTLVDYDLVSVNDNGEKKIYYITALGKLLNKIQDTNVAKKTGIWTERGVSHITIKDIDFDVQKDKIYFKDDENIKEIPVILKQANSPKSNRSWSRNSDSCDSYR